MARPQNRLAHTCVYCLKYPLYGGNRATAPVKLGLPEVVCCKTCRKERGDRSHEDFCLYKLKQSERHAKRYREFVGAMSLDREAFSKAARLKLETFYPDEAVREQYIDPDYPDFVSTRVRVFEDSDT